MPIGRETIIEWPTSNDTVVTGGGNPVGLIGGIVAAVVAVMLSVWLMSGGITTNGQAVTVDPPEVTVTE